MIQTILKIIVSVLKSKSNAMYIINRKCKPTVELYFKNYKRNMW